MAIGFIVCSVSLLASLVLGGGTRSGFLGDFVLQLVTIPPLLYAVWRLVQIPPDRRPVGVWLAPLVLVLVPLIQIIPLPDTLWLALPNRQMVAEVFDLSRQSRPALPLSVAPAETWRAMLSLVPPLAVFLCAVMLTNAERRHLSLVVIGAGLVSAILGLLQVGQGPESPLRFFAFTSSDDAVGFFANRNHFAALGYSVTLLLGAWLVLLITAGSATRHRHFKDTSSVLTMLAAATAFAALIATQAMTRSRTGIALMVVAIGGVVVLSLAARQREGRGNATGVLVGISLAGLFLVAQYALYGTIERFVGIDPLKDGRIAIARGTIEAARAFMPSGSGVGSFVSVYPAFEKVQDTMRDTYVNRAHNDILETWLETGVVGPALLVGFVIWLALRAVAVWRGPSGGDRIHPADVLLARASTLVLALLLVHSFLDYPLRTAAMMAVTAFCCALLVPPVLATEEEGREAVPVAAKSRRGRPVTAVSIPEAVLADAPSAPIEATPMPAWSGVLEKPASVAVGAAGPIEWPVTQRELAETAAAPALVVDAPSHSENAAWPDDWLKPARNELPSNFRTTRDRSKPKREPGDTGG